MNIGSMYEMKMEFFPPLRYVLPVTEHVPLHIVKIM